MDGKIPPKLQSNEEVIEELTKNLEGSCLKTDDVEKQKNKNDESSTKGAISDDFWENVGNNANEDIQNEESTRVSEPAEDFVDEEGLKDREVNLTEDEKEKLRKDAETMKNEGNTLFKNGEYKKAMITYTQGIQTCPLAFENDRAILYANRAAAKSKYMLEKESAIADCTKAVELNPNYVKAFLRRAHLYEEADKLEEALEDFKKVLTFDPAHSEANCAIRRLPPLIEEKNEKLKTEMLGKLKDLGNMVLKPFGLSTSNFELQKDSSSGGYSVKFHQNPR